MKTALFAAAVAAAGACAVPALGSHTEAYEGLYFHEFTGTVDGSEWATWGPTTGEGRLELSDLPAGGTYRATVAPDGSFVLDHGNGAGAFTSDDDIVMDFTIPGFPFHSVMHRAPHTDADFPVFFTGAIAGDASLTGTWRARVLDVDPETGETLHERTEMVGVLVEGTTVRVTDADGSWVQGVWLGEGQAGFRVIKPTPSRARYRTFPGSDLSASLNLVGDLRVLEDGSMTLAAFYQTRTPLGEQVQTMRYYELTRVPAPGALGLLGIAGVAAARRSRRRVTARMSTGWNNRSPGGPRHGYKAGAITMKRMGCALGLGCLSAVAAGSPLLSDDFEAQALGAFPGDPWRDVSEMIASPTLPPNTGSVIETTGADGTLTRAYQIDTGTGTSTGLLADVGTRRVHSISADMRIDQLPARNNLQVWTSALGLFQESAAADLNFGPQAVVYASRGRWYCYIANGLGSSNSLNTLLSSDAVREGLWYGVSLTADTLTGSFHVTVEAADGSLAIDQDIEFGPSWNPAQGAYHRIAAFDGEYTTTATPGQFTVDNIVYTPAPGAACVLVLAGVGYARRRR